MLEGPGLNTVSISYYKFKTKLPLEQHTEAWSPLACWQHSSTAAQPAGGHWCCKGTVLAHAQPVCQDPSPLPAKLLPGQLAPLRAAAGLCVSFGWTPWCLCQPTSPDEALLSGSTATRWVRLSSWFCAIRRPARGGCSVLSPRFKVALRRCWPWYGHLGYMASAWSEAGEGRFPLCKFMVTTPSCFLAFQYV